MLLRQWKDNIFSQSTTTKVMSLMKSYHNGAVTSYQNKVIVKGTVIFLHRDEVNEFKKEINRIRIPNQNIRITDLKITALEPPFITPSTLLIGFVTSVLLFIGVSVVFFQFNEGGIIEILYGGLDPIITAHWLATALLLSFIGFFIEILIIYRERRIQ